MRTTLFLSTLFAVTLVGGAALAEKPHESFAKAPRRVVERLRSKGDIVDKSYRAVDRFSPAAARSATVARQARATMPRVDKGAPRVNCSETGADCHAPRGSAHANGLTASSSQVDRPARRPAFLDKILGNDRTNFNEAGIEQGMSPRAAKRAWSRVADNNAGHGTKALLPTAKEHLPRQQQQASSARMSCNEAGECMMSSKEAKKVWAYDQIKKGIWTGPDQAKKTPADVAVARMKAEQNEKK
jgi:hypothetical protein